MSVALYIVPEQEIDGFDPLVNGKSLAQSDHEGLAALAGVRPLMEFFSVDPGDAAEAMDFEEGEAVDLGAEQTPAVEWHSAEAGLASIQGLIKYLQGNPGATADADKVIADLREFEAVLNRLAAAGIRWHLAIDY